MKILSRINKFRRSIVRQAGVKSCDECPVKYLYYSRGDKHYQTSIKGYDYTHYETVVTPDGGMEQVPRITIRENGTVTVHDKAGSDGCTPVFLFLNWYYWGVSNGPVDPITMEPVTAPAFFLHDWLLKIRDILGIPVEIIHNEFCVEIMKIDYWRKTYYCKAVKLFGPKD